MNLVPSTTDVEDLIFLFGYIGGALAMKITEYVKPVSAQDDLAVGAILLVCLLLIAMRVHRVSGEAAGGDSA